MFEFALAHGLFRVGAVVYLLKTSSGVIAEPLKTRKVYWDQRSVQVQQTIVLGFGLGLKCVPRFGFMAVIG